jgi:mannitol-1-phosphate/altronate dehydrogenase
VAHRGKTFVGFGFGPIQSALFLYEAYCSGNFDRYVIAEVDEGLVDAVRAGGGRYSINIAHPDRIEQVLVDGVRLCHPGDEPDRDELVEAIAVADEMATALPSVRFYDTSDATSVARLLADGFGRRDPSKPVILYAAENHNRAAEILSERLSAEVRADALANTQTLNTVVGKMSGVIDDADTIRRLGLAPLTPDTPRAVLVERFNHILVSRVTLEGFQRGIEVFVEKDDLLPFEEAKLYGHNAIHALIGYLARLRGLTTMAEAAHHGDVMAAARAAFIDESGAALVKKYEHVHDPLFTAGGYCAYADDLIERMLNPNLNDLISRVTRDARRKLGYDDRLFGTMRLALAQGIEPIHMAKGAAAALTCVTAGAPQTREDVGATLREVWGEQVDELADHLIALTWEAMPSLRDR